MSYSARMQKNHLYSVYFAPRGRARMFDLGMQIAQQYLSPFDRLIGVIGEAGSGKSMLIKGMFPGLELTNDDEGVNVRPLPILGIDEERSFYTQHTYHLDVRFESAFTQIHVLADAVRHALDKGKRVIVEHFELLYPALQLNAHLLLGVGEEIIVTRPNLFGPEPDDIARAVMTSVKYRKMAHTAEDLVELYLDRDLREKCKHDDVRHGFLLAFDDMPEINIPEVEHAVKQAIEEDIPVAYLDEHHVLIGEVSHLCTGPRTHVRSTGEIEGFALLPELHYDAFNKRWLLVGLVGTEWDKSGKDLNKIIV